MNSMLKRSFSFLLAVIMVLSLAPVQAFAAESDHDHGSTAESVTHSEEIQYFQEKIDEMLDWYLDDSAETEEEIAEKVAQMTGDDIWMAQVEIADIEAEAEELLTEAEITALVEANPKLTVFAEELDKNATGVNLLTTVTVLDGKVSVTDSANSNKVSNGTVTVTAKGSLFSKKTNNITVTNATDAQATLSFDYTVSSANSFKIAGATAATSGTYSVILDASASVSITLVSNSGLSSTTATLTMSNFSLVAVAAESDVTFVFDSTAGSVTVGGEAVTTGHTQTVSLAEGVTLVAAPNAGVAFLGWVDEDGTILSSEESYTLNPGNEMTVKAAFARDGGTPWFAVGAAAQKSQSTGLLGLSKLYYYEVGTSKLIEGLNEAAAAAAADASNKAIVLMNNATLPAGEYTIPAGVTLLIPFDAVNTMYTTKAVGVEVTSYAEPTAYRTLTMDNGARLTVNGAVSLSAKHAYAQGSKSWGGAPVGDVSIVQMRGDSSITVNNGGALYAYGFITGSGTVTANSGASVYEMFQIADFRGGTQSTDMDKGVFPLSQYYVQNIEVPMTLRSGAKEYAYTTIYMSSSAFGSAVAFIADSNAMFNLSSGYVVKDYDESTDRLVVKSYGDMDVSAINMTVGTSSINSKNYELPINSNLTVEVHSGSIKINQDVAMLPGSKIIIREGAICTLGSGNNIYVYDADEWGTYAGATNQKLIPVIYAPGRVDTRTDADLVDAKIEIYGTVDASEGYVYTTAGGADVNGHEGAVVKAKPGTQTVTYQLIQAADTANSQYISIPLTSAKLKNADDSYMETTVTAGTYTYANDAWVKACTHKYNETIDTVATCTTPGQKTFTCKDTVNCGHSYTEEIPALGHSEVIDLGYNPTCTETGLTEGKHCDRCGETLTAQEVVPATGHTEVADAAKAPTCTETGLTAGSHCGTCGETLVAQEAIPALGHNPGAEATCTEAQICMTCEAELKAALGHTEVADAAKAPTCTESGLTAGKHCSVCNEVLVAQEVVPATGHTEVIDVAVAATCTESGLTEGKHCDVCEEVLAAQIVIGALGHTEVIDAAVAATCTESGLTEGKHCDRCGETLTAQEVVPALGHTEVTDAAVAPDCTNTGLTEGKHCDVCGEVLTAQEEVAALGHTEVIDAAVAATCTATGLTEGKHCDVCGETLVAQEVAPALGHTEVIDAAVAATCTATGLTEGKHCDVCGETLVAQEVAPALGHTEVTDAAVAPDCTNTGLTEGKHCDVCGEVLTAQEEVAALGHTEVVDAAVDPTCTETGLTEGKHCDVCGEVLTAQEEVAALGHDMEYETEYIPGPSEEGHTYGYFCSICGYEPLTDHNMVVEPAKQPTYNAIGWNEHTKCSVCGYKVGYEELAKLPAPSISSYEDFVTNLALLEEMAYAYVQMNPGKDPLNLVIKYIRTGVDRYNSGSWGIMAGYEDAGFAAFVTQMEDDINSQVENEEDRICVTSLKNLKNFYVPGVTETKMDFGHMFGTMDITYHNNYGVNHADVGGWAGDLTDLLSTTDRHYADILAAIGEDYTFEELVAEIRANYLCKSFPGESDLYSLEDMYGNLDALYLMQTLENVTYGTGVLTEIIGAYYANEPTLEDRADFFLRNRLDGVSLREQTRNAVYNAYTGNKVIATLEGTREFNLSDLSELRKACCYAFADYMCELAGDYVDTIENKYYEVFSSETVQLAPGITQQIKYATTADNKQAVFYIATADITRDDVHLFANYNNNDPAAGWAMQRVLDQANAAQDKYGDPDSEYYIPNYNVIASTNGAGYNMSTGEPGGLLVMGGVEYQPINASGFFGILKDGTPVIGTTEEYNTIYKGQVQEAISGFGYTLVKDGKVVVSEGSGYTGNRAPRTAIGITGTGKIVLMVYDGRQEPFSCGGSMEEIAQVMLEAGCVEAINLDGGGSTTYVAKQPGSEELSVVNRPSDGAARSVATSWLVVSTAPSSTAFDHAAIESDYDYMTVGSTVKITAKGISATGDAAELPEGTTWAVSDDRWATITEDGMLTALRNGSVDVYLMLGEEVLGTKTVNIVIPDNVYFGKTNINAVYGQSVALPVNVLYEGKPVAALASDLVFSCNAEGCTIDGLNFVAAANSIYKSVKVTVALKNNEEVTATITVALYNQGEISFDFDQAVGGDRQMAWDRVVSNATTEDTMLYEVIDPGEDMVSSYTFAIDMTQIPIPQQLGDLIYMLPGADASNASAWGFLLQLAERISTLSEVKPVIRFDPNVVVDYSELKVVNDYFTMTGTEFDEATNTLTLTLKWNDQTAAIDPETANPLCIVSGIKLTPKADADWGAKNSIAIKNSGEISYKIYMRASSLYSFAQKADNQATYGIQPFVNPDDPTEKGGWFGSIYNTFEDSYTLVNAVKEGWVNEMGGYAYYVDGVKLTGVQKVDEVYYDFGENGINVGQTKYTGVFFDEDAQVYRYSKLGVLTSGWNMINGEWYYFKPANMAAATGRLRVGGVYYEFEETGKIVSGVWMNTLEGRRYYYGPAYYKSYWQWIGDELYYFTKEGYPMTGIQLVRSQEIQSTKKWYDFGEDGVCKGTISGIHEENGIYYYIEDGSGVEKYLIEYDGYYYFTTYAGKLVLNKNIYAHTTNCDLPKGWYTFGPDGKMVGSKDGEIVIIDGVPRYYENGVTAEKYLVCVDGDYYFTTSGGKLITNRTIYAWATNCDLPKGHYTFGPDGKMLGSSKDGEIVEIDGILYYYEKGQPVEKYLVCVNGEYYFAASGGKVVTGRTIYAWATNCDLPKGNYQFGDDGKMIGSKDAEIVEIDGVLYYYENGKPVEKGLVCVDGDYYFSVYKGEVIVNRELYAWATNCDLPKGTYEFGADGKMIGSKNGEIVDRDGTLYYYEKGKPVEKGLVCVDGDYYFSVYKGEVIVNRTAYAYATSCDLPKGNYEFGADGKMIQGVIERDGTLYYYENGKPAEKGLIKLDGDYYFTVSKGRVVTNQTIYTYLTNCDLPKNHYEFGPDGKMRQGFTEIDGVLYLYMNGRTAELGLIELDGEYYFVASKGRVVTNQTIYAYSTACDLPKGYYQFDAEGKMIGSAKNGEIVELDGVLYYYEKGKAIEKGLVYLDGHYYFAVSKGQLVVNKTVHVWNANGLLVETTYTFNELGQIVG